MSVRTMLWLYVIGIVVFCFGVHFKDDAFFKWLALSALGIALMAPLTVCAVDKMFERQE